MWVRFVSCNPTAVVHDQPYRNMAGVGLGNGGLLQTTAKFLGTSPESTSLAGEHQVEDPHRTTNSCELGRAI